jgi:alpha-tubulin suppressor-like RCC1 family protein
VLSGRPLDFRNTLRHINFQAFLPAVQRVIDFVSLRVFSSDLRPSEHPAPSGDPFVTVFSGPASLTGLLTASGQLFAMGQNFYGQCGVGKTDPGILYEPQLVQGFDPDDARVVDVAIGFEHVLAVTAGGSLYAWGRGDRGQCGHGDEESYTRAVRVLGPREAFLGLRIVLAAAGPATSACVTEDGRLWVWGKMSSLQKRSQRGDGWIMADQILPRLVEWDEDEIEGTSKSHPPPRDEPHNPEPFSRDAAVDVPLDPATHPCSDRRVVAISCGQAHTCALTADGRLWLLGLRGRGVLYDDSDDIHAAAGIIGQPVSDAFFPVASSMPVRGDATNSPLDAVAEMHVQTAPLEVPPGPLAGKRIIRLRSSIHHSYAVTACGRVFRFGWRLRVLEMPELAPFFVNDVAFGYRHALLLGTPR